MKKQFLAVFFSLAAVYSQAQSDKHAVIADFTGGFAFINFKNDPLVATHRRNQTTIGDEITVNGYFEFTLKNSSLSMRTGIGYAERNMYMRKTTLGDFFIALFSFGNPARDSFRLQSMQLNTKYINVPVALSWGLTKNPRQRVQFYAGAQFNNAILTGKKAILVFDETYLVPSASERKETEDIYTNTAAGFTCSIQPRLDIHIRIYKNAGLLLGLFPFQFYLNSWNKTIASNHLSFCSTMGLFCKF